MGTREISVRQRSNSRIWSSHTHHRAFLIHINIDDLCTAFYLLARDGVFSSSIEEFPRTRHIGTFPLNTLSGVMIKGSNPDNTSFFSFLLLPFLYFI
jgi:hypothetical protein